MTRCLIVLLMVSFPGFVIAAEESLYRLIDERLELMHDVAAYKWINHLPIEDPVREMDVLAAARLWALQLGIRVEDNEHFFRTQIDAAKVIQQYWFERWEARDAPDTAPDLAETLRPALLRTGAAIMERMGLAKPFDEAAFFESVAVEGLAPPDVKRIAAALANIRHYQHRLQQVLDSGILRVGTTGDYAPFSLRHSALGRFYGIDVDLAQDLANTLGVRLIWVETNWPTLMNDLTAGKYDIAMSGISVTEARSAVGSFSEPYHHGGKSAISRCDDVAKFDSLIKIDQPTSRVIVNPGGTNEKFVDTNLNRAQKIIHEDNRTIFYALIDGKADVMVTDSIEIRVQSAIHPELCPSMPNTTLNVQNKAFLLPPSVEWKARVDAWLALRKADGTVARIFERHIVSLER